MNTERIKSPTQIIFRFSSFQQEQITLQICRTSSIQNWHSLPQTARTFTTEIYIHKLSMLERCALGNHNKPFRNNAHGTFTHIIIHRLKENFAVACCFRCRWGARKPAPRMHEPETQHYEVKTRYNYFSNIKNDLKLRTKSLVIVLILIWISKFNQNRIRNEKWRKTDTLICKIQSEKCLSEL